MGKHRQGETERQSGIADAIYRADKPAAQGVQIAAGLLKPANNAI